MAKPKGRGWFKLGVVGVDSGQLLVTDPCYIRNFKSNESPSRQALLDTKTGIRWQFTYGREPDEGCKAMPGTYESNIPGSSMTFNQGVANGRIKELPDPPPSNEYSYKGCCDLTNQFDGGGLKFSMGHMGQGVVFRSGYGDGSYEVWARRNADDRIVEVRILMQ